MWVTQHSTISERSSSYSSNTDLKLGNFTNELYPQEVEISGKCIVTNIHFYASHWFVETNTVQSLFKLFSIIVDVAEANHVD